MRAAGIYLEEDELVALLKLSVDKGLEDKVYSLLHRLRTTVSELCPSTIKIIEQWFNSDVATNAGILNREVLPGSKTVKEAISSCGGGWHGLGWLGIGAWQMKPTTIENDGVCHECGEQLVVIDINPQETIKFAESLWTLACNREGKNDEFKRFQVCLKTLVHKYPWVPIWALEGWKGSNNDPYRYTASTSPYQVFNSHFYIYGVENLFSTSSYLKDKRLKKW